jgi:hypothetical protein
MRESFSGVLDREINQRQISPILSAANHRWFPLKDGVIRHRTGEKCGPAEREQYLMAGTEKVNIREGAIVLPPRALYESQFCDSKLAAEYPSSDCDQQHSQSSMAPEKRSDLAGPAKNMPLANVFVPGQSSRLRDRPIYQSPIYQSPICQYMNVTSSQERMIKTSQARRWVASSRSIL